MNLSHRRITILLLIVYLLVLTWVLLFKLGVNFSYMDSRRVNLLPFQGKPDVAELIMNLIIFIPLGIYAGVLFKGWSVIRKVFFFFLLSLGIEVIQFLLAIGAFDITDIVMNTLGGITGFILYFIIDRTFSDPVKAHKFINRVAAIGTFIFVALLILLKLNMLPIRYQ